MRTELKRQIRRIAMYVLVVLVGLYAVDWALFEARRLRGGGMGSFTVQKFLSTPLKGEKTEFDYLGTENDSCSQSFFPQYAASTWNPPCWWLARHKVKWVVTQREEPELVIPREERPSDPPTPRRAPAPGRPEAR